MTFSKAIFFTMIIGMVFMWAAFGLGGLVAFVLLFAVLKLWS